MSTAAVATPMPGMVTTCWCVDAGNAAYAVLSRRRSCSSAALRVPHLIDQFANQRFGDVAGQASDRLLGDQVELLGQFRSEVRNLLQRGEVSAAKALSRGILVEHLQHPSGGDVLGEVGQFGKDSRQQVVQAIDGLGGLLDLGPQAAGDFAQQNQRGGNGCSGLGEFDDGEACHAFRLSVSSVVRLGKWAFW